MKASPLNDKARAILRDQLNEWAECQCGPHEDEAVASLAAALAEERAKALDEAADRIATLRVHSNSITRVDFAEQTIRAMKGRQ
jgi:hypothetical protein